jgi:hypothetical protein
MGRFARRMQRRRHETPTLTLPLRVKEYATMEADESPWQLPELRGRRWGMLFCEDDAGLPWTALGDYGYCAALCGAERAQERPDDKRPDPPGFPWNGKGVGGDVLSEFPFSAFKPEYAIEGWPDEWPQLAKRGPLTVRVLDAAENTLTWGRVRQYGSARLLTTPELRAANAAAAERGSIGLTDEAIEMLRDDDDHLLVLGGTSGYIGVAACICSVVGDERQAKDGPSIIESLGHDPDAPTGMVEVRLADLMGWREVAIPYDLYRSMGESVHRYVRKIAADGEEE